MLNISTRARVLPGDDALVAGFIVTPGQPKELLLRGLGPSLPMAGALADPTIELFEENGIAFAFNDNWRDEQTVPDVRRTLPPTNPLESALWGILNPGAYTLVLRGKNGSSGIGLVETYDLDQSVDSGLANVSSRGFVGPGDDAIIGGIIIGPGDATSTRVVLRAIGPSLSQFGITNALANPTIELRDGNGAVLGHNDDWHSGPNAAAIEAIQLAPNNPRESATLRVLLPGAYTAIVRGNSDGTGVALLEAYDVGATDGLQ